MTLLADARTRSARADSASVLAQLQSRIHSMQSSHLPERGLPLLESVRPLLPGGLRAGATYSVTGSTGLALALLAEASREGAWCGVLGMPHLGTEAAVGLGVRPERLVLVPDPADRWLPVVAAMTEVLGLVVAAPAQGRVSPTDVSRLTARLRQRESTLIVLGPWPQADAALTVTGHQWVGLGRGHGRLTEHRLRVDCAPRGGRPRTRTITLHTAATASTGPLTESASAASGTTEAAPSGVALLPSLAG